MKRISIPRISLTPAVAAAINQLSTLDPDGLAAAVSLLTLLSTMPAISAAFVVRNSDNTATTQELPLTTAGNFLLTVDANGTISFSSMPTVVPIRSQDVTLDATALIGATRTITWSTPFADANYSVVAAMNGLAGAVKVIPVNGATATLTVTGVVVGTITLTAVHKA